MVPLVSRPPRRATAPRRAAASRVLRARTPEEVVAALSLGGRHAAADRIGCLHETVIDAADEPAFEIASLREAARFLLDHRWPDEPELALGPDGLLLAEWASPERGILAMVFHPDGMIRFAGVSAAGGPEPPLRVSGRLPPDRALDAARAFLPSGS